MSMHQDETQEETHAENAGSVDQDGEVFDEDSHAVQASHEEMIGREVVTVGEDDR